MKITFTGEKRFQDQLVEKEDRVGVKHFLEETIQSEEAAVWYRSSPGQRADAEAERIQRVLCWGTGYEVVKQKDQPKVVGKQEGLSRKGNFCIFPFTRSKG